MHFALLVDHWLFRVLAIAALGLEVWALVDVVRRRPDDFARIGGRDRSFWLILTGVAAVVGLLGVLAGGGMGRAGRPAPVAARGAERALGGGGAVVMRAAPTARGPQRRRAGPMSWRGPAR